jgi:hypothetical protein
MRRERNHRHEREHHERHDYSHGPDPDALGEAIGKLATFNLPGTPPVWAVSRYLDAASFPLSVGQRTIKTARITNGEPMHGAKRSDDHISRLKVLFERREPCPECNGTTFLFEYDAHHHMAGSQSLGCRTCDHVVESDEWG